MQQVEAICPKCFTMQLMTRHHVVPRRYKVKGTHKLLLLICRDCHDVIDAIMPDKRVLAESECIRITQKWLMGEHVLVYDVA